VELLVVVAIIAVLIAILLPALAKARLAAIQVSCASNLRQTATILYQYANDNKGFLPNTGWPGAIEAYMKTSNKWPDTGALIFPIACPIKPMMDHTRTETNFTVNSKLGVNLGTVNGVLIGWQMKLFAVRPGDTILVFDAKFAQEFNSGAPTADYSSTYGTDFSNNVTVTSYVDFRHGPDGGSFAVPNTGKIQQTGQANIAYVDTHVDSLYQKELRGLTMTQAQLDRPWDSTK
jgi:prepilin-type processing-associated H-X9-DG protein